MLGMLLLGGGTSGLAYQAILFYRRFVEQRVRAEELARRSVIRGERRRRSQFKRMLERSEHARTAAAELQRHDKRAHDRKQELAAELLESELKTVREAELREQVRCLKSQSHAQLVNSAVSIFSNRGWLVSVPNSEAPFDLLLFKARVDQESVLFTARCVPPERIADLTDLRGLDEWREQACAAHGYLISVRGFDERAVRELRSNLMCVTLVEAHLLALWSNTCQDY